LRSATCCVKRAAPDVPAPALEKPVFELVPLNAVPDAEVEALLDRAFGQDRHGRTAYMIRGDGTAIPTLSFAAVSGDMLLGSIQCWPIALMTAQAALPLVMVGPVAVAPGHQGDGIGRALVARALEVAAASDLGDALMLIGDPDYYGRFFGFSADRTAAWQAPGPVERHRLLALGGAVPDDAGMLGPRAGAAG
jgi:predicted N-acetyltransferase YhbS